jgi:two-component system sensor histidine kinase TctE
VHALNLAFERYHGVVAQMQRFNSNAAHQLRTPLAALRTGGEVALQRARTAGEYREVIATMLERTAVMSRLVEQLLELAALEARPGREAFSEFVAAPHLRRVVDDFAVLVEQRRITLTLDLDPAIRVRGDAVLLEQVAANILDNALRFTPEGGVIAVHLQAWDEQNVALWIEDSGPGIPEAERQAVFERFEQGRRPDTTHTGLGLAIVAEIARVHGGSVFATAACLGGARVGVALPRAIPAT